MITTVAVSGTPEPIFPCGVIGSEFYIRALSANTDTVYIGREKDIDLTRTNKGATERDDGPVAADDNGMALDPDFWVILQGSDWWIDAAVSGEGVAWVRRK